MERGTRRDLVSEFIVAESLSNNICNGLLDAGFDVETEQVEPGALWEFARKKIRVYEIMK